MASAIGQTATGADNDIAVTTDPTASPTVTGSTFVVWFEYAAAGVISTVTDNKSNAYSILGTVQSTNGVERAVYLCQNGAGGAGHTATVTLTNAQSIAIIFLEITGVEAVSLDQNVDLTDDLATPFTTGTTGTTTQANEIVLAGYWINEFTATTITWGNSYTEAIKLTDGSLGTIAIGYKNLSATGTQQASVTLSAGDETDAWIATFKDSGGGGGAAYNPVPTIVRYMKQSGGLFR